ncbi:hypothetical protein [Dactylosporangium sp. NPDC049140]|uniref:hypothetical protein n=1 Tax=Dactylosporangium sp. NPDC049140 TaxID=3155647 RepID=UPI0034119F26
MTGLEGRTGLLSSRDPALARPVAEQAGWAEFDVRAVDTAVGVAMAARRERGPADRQTRLWPGGPYGRTLHFGLARRPGWFTRGLPSAASRLPGLAARPDAGPLAKGLSQLAGRRSRRAFVRTARTVIDWRGQARPVGAS